MLTVSPVQDRVESLLAAGELSCPACEGEGRLAPWGWARPRRVGRAGRGREVVPRRSRCHACGATHVLLPVVMLARRGDWAQVIGRALEMRVAGVGQRPIAAVIGVPRSTVRGWLARFVAVAERLRAHFTRWAMWRHPGLVRLDPMGSVPGDALAAIVAAADEAGLAGRWRFVSAATGGRLLSNTSSPYPSPWMD